jgi:hypothetical protein
MRPRARSLCLALSVLFLFLVMVEFQVDAVHASDQFHEPLEILINNTIVPREAGKRLPRDGEYPVPPRPVSVDLPEGFPDPPEVFF